MTYKEFRDLRLRYLDFIRNDGVTTPEFIELYHVLNTFRMTYPKRVVSRYYNKFAKEHQ